MVLSSAELKSWVLTRLQEKDSYQRGGNFVGKATVKRKLRKERPQYKDEIDSIIRELKGNIDFQIYKHPNSWPKILETETPNNASTSSASLTSQSAQDVSNRTVSQGDQRERSQNVSIPLIGAAITSEQPVGSSSRDQLNLGPALVMFDAASTQNSQSTASTSVEGLPDHRSGHVTENQNEVTSGELNLAQEAPAKGKILALQRFLSETKVPKETSSSEFERMILDLDDNNIAEEQTVKNAVIFSDHTRQGFRAELPQYGLLGTFHSSPRGHSKLYLNTNIPFSAFVCGIQGSGKSHTSTCMIENCVIPASGLGVLEKPLTALVFNFAEYTSESAFRPCEAVFLAAPNQKFPTPFSAKKVKVLVSPSNYRSLAAAYSQIPGVHVEPFKLQSKDLNITTMLTLMCVDQSQGPPPLYMGIVTKILREMATTLSGDFNYIEFRRRLRAAGLDPKQVTFLDQRLDLLESFMDLEGSTKSPSFEPGEVTILDLSCPFLDASTACILFKIGMGMFLESDAASGKVIFVDEAHKFMTETPGAKTLTESLMKVIREQRHYGVRVIISTQEPTISPKLIDLCSMTVIHRFTSPEWLSVLRRHISIQGNDVNDSSDEGGLYKQILRLKTGEALVFAPSAVMGKSDGSEETEPFRLLRVKVRRRITWDGGISMVSV